MFCVGIHPQKYLLMKPNFFRQCAVLGVGAALLFTATTTRADEPKRKHHASSEKKADDQSVTPARADRTGQVPSQDGRHSTSVEGSQVGGANGQETRVPTGSHIPQTYHRKAYTTDRSDNTFIYDKNDQRLRSTNNVGDSLRSVPGVTVGGLR